MASELIVREATEADIEQQVDMFIAVAEEGRWILEEPPLDRDQLVLWRHKVLAAEDAISLVAEREGVLVGQLDMTVRHGVGFLGMDVVAAHRRRGIGRALVQAAIDRARADGLGKLALHVFPHNEAAIGLYESFGFQREAYHPKEFVRKNGEAWDAISMGLVLTR